MKIERSCGVLLHITSLPGSCGIGTLGPEADDFIDFLAHSGQGYWQILPTGPVSGPGFSPYSSPSTFAGNYFFISLERLKAESWFGKNSGTIQFADSDFVDFERVKKHTLGILGSAFADFNKNAGKELKGEFERFRSESFWLEDYSLFTALASHYKTAHWPSWEGDIAKRKPQALQKMKRSLSEEIDFYGFVQFLFFRQWFDLKKRCADKGVKIIGDIPIYISLDGADAWSNRGILELDPETGESLNVAGVPPDYFSETGQRWGNPLFRWYDRGNKLHEETFLWWERRIKHLSRMMDLVRIDHFRGFESFWSIPAEEKTAVNGEWVQGPGMAFFRKIRERLGDLALVAEDLGVITPEVEKLRDDLSLPGMKILQFAFDFNNKNSYLPHSILNPNCVLYTGTHDNNTTNGWFYGGEINEDSRRCVLEYLGSENQSDMHWQLIRAAYRSTANLVIVPAQDLLGYGPEFRMNVPGLAENNWRWKLKKGALNQDISSRIKRMAHIYNRILEYKNEAQ